MVHQVHHERAERVNSLSPNCSDLCQIPVEIDFVDMCALETCPSRRGCGFERERGVLPYSERDDTLIGKVGLMTVGERVIAAYY